MTVSIAKKIVIGAGCVVMVAGIAYANRWEAISKTLEAEGLAEPFVGVTTDGQVEEGLFAIAPTGVSTEPVREAALTYLATLDDEERRETLYSVDDDEWRKWMNVHFYIRQGLRFRDMNEAQAEAGYGLMRASLSDRGYALARDIMRLDHTLAELNDDNFTEYGDDLFHITMMGEPHASEPWGWQLDGHHLVVNYFVLGDQVVMSPVFVGAEPVIAPSGKFAGTAILQAEQDSALEFVQLLSKSQLAKAVISSEKVENSNQGEFFKDNVQIPYEGLRAEELDEDQTRAFLALVERFIGNMDEGHARVKMHEVVQHLDRTYFAWVGATADDAVFYYRIHSPVLLIEFDHQKPVGLRHLTDSTLPQRDHVHVVIRTPNGNDYGKDLLRQHLAATRH
jgi:hypothetical protein